MLSRLLVFGVLCLALDAGRASGGGLDYLTNGWVNAPSLKTVEDRQEDLARRSSELAAAHDMLEGQFRNTGGLHDLLTKVGLDLAGSGPGGKKGQRWHHLFLW